MDEKKTAPKISVGHQDLWLDRIGSLLPGQAYSGYPVTSAVAYGMSHGGGCMASPFAEQPKFVPFNNGKLGNAILRAAEAIKKNPEAQVWAVEMHDGEIALYVGDYGNVGAHIALGALAGSNAANRDLAFANATMKEYEEIYISRGQKPPFWKGGGGGGGGASSDAALSGSVTLGGGG